MNKLTELEDNEKIYNFLLEIRKITGLDENKKTIKGAELILIIRSLGMALTEALLSLILSDHLGKYEGIGVVTETINSVCETITKKTYEELMLKKQH